MVGGYDFQLRRATVVTDVARATGAMHLHHTSLRRGFGSQVRFFCDREKLKRARALIEQRGYWRRKQELEDAEEAAKYW